jgi:hypothetical protein
MTWTVEGMDQAEGNALKDQLLDHIEQDHPSTPTTGGSGISFCGTIAARSMPARTQQQGTASAPPARCRGTGRLKARGAL